MRAASGVIVAAEKVEILPCGAGGEESRAKSVLGDAVVALERENKTYLPHLKIGRASCEEGI